MSRLGRTLLSIIAVLVVSSIATSAWGSGSAVGPRQEGGVRRAYHRQTGKLSFLGADPAEPIVVPSAQAEGLTSDERAMAILEAYGSEFGLNEPGVELVLIPDKTLARDRGSVRYQQTYQGIPVLAGELIVNTDPAGNLRSISGEISPDLSISTTPTVTGDEARAIALGVTARAYGIHQDGLKSSEPELWIFDERLLLPSSRPAELVWRMDVEGLDRPDIRELVLVNATRGGISLRFNQIDSARNRMTYTANNGTSLPGSLVCNEANPTCSGGDAHAVAAHEYAGDTYDFFSSFHGRDSIDDAGMTLVSTVRYSSGYANAFWNGSQMVYGDAYGFPLADDVVGHELTHGVTEYTSNLFYYYQSGAINESFSDVWGEFVDQWNGAGNDTPGVKWLMGEDVSGLGALRDMEDPPAYSDPDKMTSANYYTGSSDYAYFGDNGGVHTNSGVNNKAVFLMTDGGSFNGETVTGLGMTKVAKIYYEVQTGLLTSGADYADLYNALYQGCLDLMGTSGITSSDCQEVRDATEAVEMNLEPTAGYNPEAEACPAGQYTVGLFSDDLEDGSGNWTFAAVSGSSSWGWYGGYATSGNYMLFGDNSYSSADSYSALNSDVSLPAGSSPYLWFAHAFGLEDPDYDGAWLEYSTNGGGAWTDAGALFDDGLDYTGYINTFYGDGDNSHTGRHAFVGDSHGYVSTRYDLGTLAGQNVRFRWRLSSDSIYYDWGWFVDDVRIYLCTANPPLYLPLIMK